MRTARRTDVEHLLDGMGGMTWQQWGGRDARAVHGAEAAARDSWQRSSSAGTAAARLSAPAHSTAVHLLDSVHPVHGWQWEDRDAEKCKAWRHDAVRATRAHKACLVRALDGNFVGWCSITAQDT